MHTGTKSTLGVAALLVVTGAPPAAADGFSTLHAQAGGYVQLDANWNTLPALGMAFQTGWRGGDVHLFGRLRATYVAAPRGGPVGASLSAGATVEVGGPGPVRPFVGGSAGFGLLAVCVRGDFCGGLGPLVGAEAGVTFHNPGGVGVQFDVEVLTQFGIANVQGPMLLPLVGLGLVFGD